MRSLFLTLLFLSVRSFAVESKAAASPIQLTLRLNKTVVKSGESLWFQIELKNIGRKMIVVVDPIFDPKSSFEEELGRNVASSRRIFIEVFAPDGKKLPWTREARPFEGCRPMEMRSPTGELKKHLDAIIQKGKEQGLSQDQIQNLLDDDSRQRNEKEDEEKDSRTIRRVGPGQSVTTPPWVYSGVCGDRVPLPEHIGDFAELWNFRLSKPGSYGIRAIYDMRPDSRGKNSTRLYPERSDSEQIYLATPTRLIEVKP